MTLQDRPETECRRVTAKIGRDIPNNDAPVRIEWAGSKLAHGKLGADRVPPISPRRLLLGEVCPNKKIQRKDLLGDCIFVTGLDLDCTVEMLDSCGGLALQGKAGP